ncbi:class I SAM-dependent RNA methyltransferase [Hoeflea prorocentri]|uniref:Class I SAM-dependent RNA methyltransferase n=1 Tax=Hoeflea prorocentri TaxID=1922333 RepID=A0A9X3UI05_9HYPH|nr:class I SAM-dependent RNA methyltransferase [Hoeflea prorocentri]MCY6381692.1 class I SAM-dependent RNA methyltransferase [Hoeflea prorocentri]MDA5399492.1 class I SAM-dependent RNA methyltransferase [Hoeflea prorocentri]
MTARTVTIESIGAQGDGVATVDGNPVYVGYGLPGETAKIEQDGSKSRLVAIDTPSPDRAKPPCPHFGPDGNRCGGCALQHLEIGAYHSWKAGLVANALAARGIETAIADMIPCAPGQRRRAVFTARAIKDRTLFGFHESGTHRIVDIGSCTVLSDGIVSELAKLRAIAGLFARGGKPVRMTVLESLTGLDISVDGISKLPEKRQRQAVDLTLNHGFARLCLGSETLVEARRPVLQFAGTNVEPPPGSFVQASAHAQERMIAIVTGYLQGSKSAADLFCGCGTFALALARQSAVLAVESSAPALAALDHAARHTQGLKPLRTERRDLFRRPMMANELKKTDAVVFDPPRAGAQAQATELAASNVQKIAAVSCNPATLARDLRILIDGGFRLTSVTPIDQFLWSPHVEAIALLER